MASKTQRFRTSIDAEEIPTQPDIDDECKVLLAQHMGSNAR